MLFGISNFCFKMVKQQLFMLQGYQRIIVIIFLIITTTEVQFRHQQTLANHQIFDDSWGDSTCDDACQREGGKVCGHFEKECCQECSGFPRYTCVGNKFRGLNCSYHPDKGGIVAKMSGNSTWIGDGCNDACEMNGGTVCGTMFNSCCKTTCQTTAFIYKSCAGDKFQNLDCSYRKPTTAASTITSGFKSFFSFW